MTKLLALQWGLLAATGAAFAASGLVANQPAVSSTSNSEVSTSIEDTTFVYPIKEQINVQSARIDQNPITPTVRPVEVTIQDISVATEIVPVGVDENNLFDVPAQSVGWYKYGSSPGSPGSTVLAAHVDYNGEKGAFFNLSQLQVGSTFTLTLQDGKQVTYSVTSNTSYDKTQLPLNEIFAKDGPETLKLVTCGGNFDETNRTYLDNVVVTAKKITR